MVVNGGLFHSLVIPYNSDVDMTDKMAGKAVLICRTNSHPFVDRTLSLEHPVKIGRSVARARAAQTNGVFDCKVLSRNHALIWYNNGKFYLQDTKSSNGTFVNNQRLSKSGEESLPREVSSGDIVQFGVDVLENARKVTHGCIVADLKLYLPDGKESKASPSTGILSGSGNVFIEDLYQLNQYIQEALQREQMLQTKLDSLQKLTVSLRRAADLGWKALIAEDRLLSRVEILENQLQTYSKSMGEDKLRGELRLLQEDKGVYQGLAKDCLQKVLQEKVEALQKCQTLEEALRCSEAECANYKVVLRKDQEEVIELAHKHSVHVARIVELQNQLQEAEEHHKEAITRLESDNEDLNNEVKRLLINEVVMQDKIKRLEASGEIVGRQLLGIHDHLTTINQRKGSTDDVICKNNEEMNEENEKVDSDPMITILERLSDTVEDQKINKDVYELIKAQVEKKSKMDRITALEAELGLHAETMAKYKEENASLQQTLRTVEQTLRDQCLNRSVATIIETMKTEKISNGTQAIQNLESQQAQIEELKEAIKESHSKIAELEQTVISTQIDLNNAKKTLTETMKGSVAQDEKLEEAQQTKEEPDSSVIMLKDQIDTSSDITLSNVTSQEKFQTESQYEEEVTNLKKQLEESQQTVNKLTYDAERLRDDLREAISELESLRRIADIRMQDNRTVDELTQSRMEAAALKRQIDGLILQLKARPLDARPSDRPESFGDDMATSVDRENLTLKLIIKKLQSRVIELDENLILVKQKFVECNNGKTALQHELSELKLDYDAVVHQPFFVSRRHYLLGFLVALVVAMLLPMLLYPSS